MRQNIIKWILVIVGFVALSYITFPELLGGKIVNQSDISGWQGMSHEMMEWNENHPDNQTAWTNSMFGGMPTTTIHSSTKGDLTQYLYNILLIGKRPATYLFISLLGSFLLLLAFGVDFWLAILGSLAISFCSYNFQIIQVGHNTKMQAIAFMPWVLATLVYTFKSKKTLLGAALFGLTLSFQIKANHPQISYYLAIIILIYSISKLIESIKNHTLKKFFITCSFLLILGGVGIATNAIKLLPTLEYTPYSMRGGSSDGQAKGLDIDYATAWSYGWEELPNLMIPNFNGGASAGAAPKHSETVDLLKASGQTNLKEISKNLPYYWGPQPFTAGPMYIGAITVFLFVLGICIYRKWWLIICTLLAIALSLGSHFMGFTKFFYDYIPLYNKFRTVSMALTVLQITLPLLAFLTLDKFVKDDSVAERFKKKGWIALAITGGFCLLYTLIPEIAGDFSAASDMDYPEALQDAFAADRRTLLRSDAFLSMLLIVASYILLYSSNLAPKGARKTFETQKDMRVARRRSGAILIGIMGFISLFAVSKRYLNRDDFVSERSFKNQFALREVDKMILEDKDPSYRVLDLTVNVFNDSHPSYWHKNIGGYSPAKLQRYQEFIDTQLNREINSLAQSISGSNTIEEAEEALPYLDGLAKLNCKYIIIGDELPPLEYKYTKGAAWFENERGQVSLERYEPNKLKYSYTCDTDSRLIFSEVYYPKGWKLLCDGKEIEIEMYENLLRSAIVPGGSHSLEMSFEPQSYKLGEAISLSSSILLILLVLGIGIFRILSKK